MDRPGLCQVRWGVIFGNICQRGNFNTGSEISMRLIKPSDRIVAKKATILEDSQLKIPRKE